MAALAPIEMAGPGKAPEDAGTPSWLSGRGRAFAAAAPRAHRPCVITDTGLAGQNHGHRGAWAVWGLGDLKDDCPVLPAANITAVSWPGLREPQNTPRPAPLAARPSLVKRRSRYAPVAVSQEQGRAGWAGLRPRKLRLANPCDLYLDTSGWGKGIAWINGFCLSSYWPRGLQHTLYVPAPMVRQCATELIVLELQAAASFVAASRLNH